MMNNEKLLRLLTTLEEVAPALRSAYTIERSAWQRASLATAERVALLSRGRAAIADALEAGLPEDAAFQLLDKQLLLPADEISHFTRAYKDKRLDITRFIRYLRNPAMVSSQPDGLPRKEEENIIRIKEVPTAGDIGSPVPSASSRGESGLSYRSTTRFA